MLISLVHVATSGDVSKLGESHWESRRLSSYGLMEVNVETQARGLSSQSFEKWSYLGFSGEFVNIILPY